MADAPRDKSLVPAKKRIEIKVPDYYRPVEAEVWQELEEYLFNGFLTTFSRVHGRTFVFKTLNHNEVRNLDFFRPMKKSPPEIKSAFRASFIAHSIFHIDGENTLFERPKHIRRLVEVVSKIDPKILEDIIGNLGILNEKINYLSPLLEVYVNENRSRLRWLQIKGTPVHSPLATGIAGTDELGMNYVQQMWVALNHLQDARELMEAEWTNAKFIGSCFNSKGVRSVDEKDRAKREQEKQKREERKMKVLYAYLNRSAGGDDAPPEQVLMPDGRMAKVEKRFIADSAEELAEQLSAALSGEKDFHDMIVEQQQKKNVARAREIESYRRQFYQRPPMVAEAAQASSIPLSGASRILGGRAEVDAHLGKLRDVERVKRNMFQQVNLDLEAEEPKPYRRIQDPSENSDKK